MEGNGSDVTELPSWYLDMGKITEDPSQGNRYLMRGLKRDLSNTKPLW
jgi:hypothetical protein